MNIVKEIEKTFAETCCEFKRIQEEQYETFCKKQYDYGQHNITLGMDLTAPDGLHLSITAIIIRINERINDRTSNRMIESTIECAKE